MAPYKIADNILFMGFNIKFDMYFVFYTIIAKKNGISIEWKYLTKL